MASCSKRAADTQRPVTIKNEAQLYLELKAGGSSDSIRYCSAGITNSVGLIKW